MNKFQFLLLLLLGLICIDLLAQERVIPADYQLVYQQDFSTPQAINDFTFFEAANTKN